MHVWCNVSDMYSYSSIDSYINNIIYYYIHHMHAQRITHQALRATGYVRAGACFSSTKDNEEAITAGCTDDDMLLLSSAVPYTLHGECE